MNRRRFLKTAIGSGVVAATVPLSGLIHTASAQNPYDLFRVTTDVLNGRTGPGIGYDVITAYFEGDIVEVSPDLIEYADGYTWRAVNVKPGPVWVAEEYLEPVNGDGPRDRVQVADGPLNVRSEPSLGGEVVFAAPTGANGTMMDPSIIEADGYSWVYVQLDDSNVTGWMALEFLSYIDVG